MLAPLILNLALSIWLLVSAWIMPHGPVTSWNAMIVALLAATVSLLAWAAPGRPGLRHGTSVLATWLVASTMLLPHVALSTMANEVLVAMGFGAVALLLPAHRKHAARPTVRPA
jgi:hypothetical protein